jgi:orotidine-5'-phosphate decarboxylase
MAPVHDPLIVALDVPTAGEARALVAALGDSAGFYKVGLELYTAAGPDFIRELIGQGKRVFADLKFYDIGETVKRATAQVARLGATFLTIHGSGQVMRAATEGRASASLKLLAVTVLTSFDAADLREFGYDCGVRDLISVVVHKAQETGIDGVITSPVDAAAVRAQSGPGLLIVTPGVRSRGSAIGDQKRIATPAEALHDGADYLVIGRQVTRSADPRAAILSIRDEIEIAVSAGR